MGLVIGSDPTWLDWILVQFRFGLGSQWLEYGLVCEIFGSGYWSLRAWEILESRCWLLLVVLVWISIILPLRSCCFCRQLGEKTGLFFSYYKLKLEGAGMKDGEDDECRIRFWNVGGIQLKLDLFELWYQFDAARKWIKVW